MLAGNSGSYRRSGDTPVGSRGPDSSLPVATRHGNLGHAQRDIKALLPGSGDDVSSVPQPATSGSEGHDRERLFVHPDRGRASAGEFPKRDLPVRGSGASIDSAILQGGEGAGGEDPPEP